ncbi:MAG TPA: serine hydrolase [Candidatus Dormibacteraeota bacterium]|nr:serine hydrolase [Candidatus Dormibacteraeota bacterium]
MSLVVFLFSLGLCAPITADEFPTANWKTATPERQGLDSAVLAEALDYVRTKGIPLHSFLIVRNGVVVLDAYLYPYTGREVHDVASVTKSFTSAAIGIAIKLGYIKGVDESVLSLLPRVSADSDPRRRSVSIRHLLTMTSGLDCDTEGGEKALAAMRHSADWAAFALTLPMRTEPGSQYAYCSCNNHLLSSILTATTGKSLLEFAQKNLFRPIGVTDVIWPADPTGRTHGWGDLHLHPRDMARLGLLYLNHGQWGDTQIVPPEWVSDSSKASVTVREGVGYGYSWWVNTARPPIFEAVGRGGQRIAVLPQENMVVVFTGGGANTDEIAPFLFRAIRSDKSIPENPESMQRLTKALSRASEPVREMANIRTPALARNVSGRTYSVSPNPLDLRTLELEFKDTNKAEVILQFDAETWALPVGLDGNRRFAPVGPQGLSVASVGRWTSDDEFLLDLDTVANVNHFLFDVRFEGNRIHIRMNEMTGEMKDVTVEGVVAKQ